MKKNSRYIIIIVILIVYLLTMYILVGKKNLRAEKVTTKLVIGDDTVWELKKKHWTSITQDSDLVKLNWTLFHVFDDGKDLGELYLWRNDDTWYLFDKDKKAINHDGRLLAYQSNYGLKIKKHKVENVIDYNEVAGFLQEKNISSTDQFSVANYVQIDIDNDGVDEIIYLFSNALISENAPDEVFTLVFMRDDGKNYILYETHENNYGFNGCKPYVNYVLDLNDDNNYEMILSCGRYSDLGVIDMLLEFKNGKFNNLVTNQ